MKSYSAAKVPPRDLRSLYARRAAATVEPGREGGVPISATTLGLGHGPGIKLASPAPQAGTVRRPSPSRPRAGRAMP